MTTDFAAHSMPAQTTKMFTGPAVLQLVDKGIVHLDDAISMHIDPILHKVRLRLIGYNISTARSWCR